MIWTWMIVSSLAGVFLLACWFAFDCKRATDEELAEMEKHNNEICRQHADRLKRDAERIRDILETRNAVGPAPGLSYEWEADLEKPGCFRLLVHMKDGEGKRIGTSWVTTVIAPVEKMRPALTVWVDGEPAMQFPIRKEKKLQNNSDLHIEASKHTLKGEGDRFDPPDLGAGC